MSLQMPSSMPVTLVGGFLGSGKTTLMRRILSAPHGQRLAVIVNDFGDLNIDAELISEVTDDTVQLTNGCLCCSARGDLLIAARRLMLRDPAPDGLYVETSGVARPDLVARSLMGSEFGNYFSLQTMVTLVDAENFAELDFDAGELAIDQAAVADLVVLNKTDLAGPEKTAGVRATLQEAIPHVRLVESVEARVPLELILSAGSARLPDKGARGPDERPEAGDLFETITWRRSGPVSAKKLQDAMARLPVQVYRLKGFVYTQDQPAQRLLVQMAGRRGTLEPFGDFHGPAQSELVLIMKAGAMDRRAIDAIFDACLDTAAFER